MGDQVEPPPKKIKAGQEFIDLIEECYDITFNHMDGIPDDKSIRLEEGLQQIRKILEQIQSSSDVSFGPTRSSAKITWGKCLSLMLQNGPESIRALKVLTDRLSPSGGLL
jgi:hypothetical protein